MPYFSQHYTVILADSRSQGKSLDPNDPITFEVMADDFATLLDRMHIPSAYVIGWSDGGINALLLAIRPEHVRFAETGIAGEITAANFLGERNHFQVRIPGRGDPVAVSAASAPPGPGVHLGFPPDFLMGLPSA